MVVSRTVVPAARPRIGTELHHPERYGCTGKRVSMAACSDKHVDEWSQAPCAGGFSAHTGNAIGAPTRLGRSSEAAQCGRLHKGSSRYFSRHANEPKNISISLQQLRALLTQ